MATTKKTAAKTTSVDLALTKVTKNTYRFDTDEDGAAVTTIYVQQSAFAKEPKGVTVTVTPS